MIPVTKPTEYRPTPVSTDAAQRHGILTLATARGPRRAKNMAPRSVLALLGVLIATIISGLPAKVAHGNPIESHERIVAVVETFVAAHVNPAHRDVEISVGALDSRLRLAACDSALDTFFATGSRAWGNTTVGVRCQGAHPWSIYVPVRVQVFKSILVSAHPLPRGKVLAETDMVIERRDLAALRGGYLVDTDDARGQVVRRPLGLGMPLSPDALEAPRLVERGERITIIARSGGLEVRMAGKALMHGALGDRIQVRNLSSKRTLEARVLASGTVQVAM